MWWAKKSEKVPEDVGLRLERLEREMKAIQIEWTDTYDKFRRLHMRVAKQVQRQEESVEPDNAAVPSLNPAVNGEGEPVGARLSPTQAKVQEQILRRRNRLGG